MFRITLLFTIFLLSFNNGSAHSGNTDSSGCHKDHSNGTYHCHYDKQDKTQLRVPNFIDSEKAEKGTCCRVCVKGKACGNSCISRNKTCYKPPGCACDG